MAKGLWFQRDEIIEIELISCTAIRQLEMSRKVEKAHKNKTQFGGKCTMVGVSSRMNANEGKHINT